jgi:hypothetical protein
LERVGQTAVTYNDLETSTKLKFTLPCADAIRQSKKCVPTMKEESNFIEALWLDGTQKVTLALFQKNTINQ